jgi:hypothetical protein
MTNFHVGQKVVCVDVTTPWDAENLRPQRIYTITAIKAEITHRGPLCSVEGVDGHWFVTRFRPVAEKPTAMDIIRSIVLDPSREIPNDPREPVITPVPEYEGFEVRI